MDIPNSRFISRLVKIQKVCVDVAQMSGVDAIGEVVLVPPHFVVGQSVIQLCRGGELRLFKNVGERVSERQRRRQTGYRYKLKRERGTCLRA